MVTFKVMNQSNQNDVQFRITKQFTSSAAYYQVINDNQNFTDFIFCTWTLILTVNRPRTKGYFNK